MRTLLAVLTSVFSSAAVAQMPGRVFPASFLMHPQPAGVANDPRFAAMQARHVHVAAYYYDAIPPYTVLPATPANAAILLTDLIKRNSDINLDGQVDLTDIDEFDAAFINANP